MSTDPTPVIRPLDASDRTTWERLWQGYLDFYGTSLDAEMIALAFERLLSDDPHEPRGLFAEVAGRPAGLAHFLFHRHGWLRAPVCYLQDLWVEPDRRGTGLGRALIEAVSRDAEAAGAASVYWLTAHDNAAARRLYDRVARDTGFVRYQRP